MSEVEKFVRRHAVRGPLHGDDITFNELVKLCDALKLPFEIDNKKYVVTIATQLWGYGHPDWDGSRSNYAQVGLALKVEEL